MFVGSVSAATFRAGNWPIEVTVAPDQPTISLGEPAWLSFAVTNLSDESLQLLVGGDYQNELGRPASFTVVVQSKDNKRVEQPDVGRGTGGLIGPADLPAKGRYVFRLFVPHWATFTEAGTYSLICRRMVQLIRPAADGAFTKQPISEVLVEARTTLGVLPRNDAQLKNRIVELGEQMLEAQGEKAGDEAVIGLSWIEDPRVVPYFVRALQVHSYTLKFIAIQVLARFATDEALSGLRIAVGTSASEFNYVTGDKPAELAARIRSAAVGALMRCRHPRASELLVAQRHDPDESVRVSVVQALARLPRAQAGPLLVEMTKDSSGAVRDAAQRYLNALQQAAAATKK